MSPHWFHADKEVLLYAPAHRHVNLLTSMPPCVHLIRDIPTHRAGREKLARTSAFVFHPCYPAILAIIRFPQS